MKNGRQSVTRIPENVELSQPVVIYHTPRGVIISIAQSTSDFGRGLNSGASLRLYHSFALGQDEFLVSILVRDAVDLSRRPAHGNRIHAGVTP